LRAFAIALASPMRAGFVLEAKMRKILAPLALGCALVLAMSVAASACERHKQATSASSDSADQTAQAQPASDKN